MKKNKNWTILDIRKKLKNQEITYTKLAEKYAKATARLIKKNTRAIITNFSEQTIQQAAELANEKNLLAGIPCTLKDNICIENTLTTGGSIFLKDFYPSYTATVAKLLKQQKVLINSKTNMDELGLGGTGTFSGFGIIKNIAYPWHITGGSSSGTVLAVKEQAAVFGIGTDTGDSIRRPCSFMGLYGYKPTYGLVSRYGVLPYAPSLDHVGIIANSIQDTAIVLTAIAQKDPLDHTCISANNIDYFVNLTPAKKVKLGIIKQVYSLFNNKKIEKAFLDLIAMIKSSTNFELVEIDLDMELINVIPSVYQVISYSEAVSSWNNLNGILFGNNKREYTDWQDLLVKTRTNDLSAELKKRFVFGTFCTNQENFSKYYFKAKQLIDVFKNIFAKHFQTVDAFILPGASTTAIKLKDSLSRKITSDAIDDLLEITNFTGAPSFTIPYKKINRLPFGVNLFTNYQEDQKLLNIALALENLIKGEEYDS